MKLNNNHYYIIISLLILIIWLLCCSGYEKNNFKVMRQVNNRAETVIDIDGNVYHTVKIGTQIWTVENLKVTHYKDGSNIPEVKNDEERWSDLTTGALCWYDDNPNMYKNKYGALYNYYSIKNEKGLCPEGWHVPTTDEWKIMIDYLGGVDKAGSYMKLTTEGTWQNVEGMSNKSGFSAVPAGGRGRIGASSEGGNYATWWSSTSYDSLYAWHWGLHPDNGKIRFNPGHKNSGFSIRLVKD